MEAALQQVLLVEDNRDDVFLMQRAVKKAAMPWNMSVLMDGQQALDFIHGTGTFSNHDEYPFPTIIFLDLKLPYVSGLELLGIIRKHERYRAVPVVILTSSPEERDQHKAIELGADAYLVKPPLPEMLRNVPNLIGARSKG